MGTIQIILIGVIVLIVLGMLAAYLIGQESDRKKRLASVIRGQSSGAKKFSAQDVQNKRRAEIARKLKETKEIDDIKKGKKKKPTMALMLEQAGLSISVKQYWIYSGVS